MEFLDLQTAQEAYKAKYGKYFQVKRGDKKAFAVSENVILPKITVGQEVHEHLFPDGSRGFTLYETRLVNGAIETRAQGAHNHDWEVYEPAP